MDFDTESRLRIIDMERKVEFLLKELSIQLIDEVASDDKTVKVWYAPPTS